jgi:uncharacterized protein
MNSLSTLPTVMLSRTTSRPVMLLALGGGIALGGLVADETTPVIDAVRILVGLARDARVDTDAVVAIVLLAAGIVSGLSGFAFSAVAACILWLLPPLQAMPLIMALSACNQLQMFANAGLRQQIVWSGEGTRDGALPYIAGGLVGIPLGLAVLRVLPAPVFSGSLGAFLVLYSSVMALKPARFRIDIAGWKMSAAVGFAGGVVGGFSGFPGSMPVIYLGLRGVGKTAMRGVTLPYILVMQIAALGMLAVTHVDVFDKRFLILWAVTVPAVLLGSAIGVRLYRRLSDVGFQRAVLALLAVSGVSLVVKAWL